MKPTAGSFAFTSPYTSCWLYKAWPEVARNLFGQKVIRERDFREKIAEAGALPELMIFHNFIVERAGILALCRGLGINTLHNEDGFFPHYGTGHIDPLGFCWESSLTRMVFRECREDQRQVVEALRDGWLEFPAKELPSGLKAPYVLWPLQLIGDKVNQWDLGVSDWVELLSHFRQCLPQEFQLQVKAHPRAKASDMKNVEQWCRQTPNVLMAPPGCDLKTLIQASNGVAGANSSVLTEARLMFHKPVYAYARSWYTNHPELFMPVHLKHKPRALNRLDMLADNRLVRQERLDDYTNWFTWQLISRQVPREIDQMDPEEYRQRVLRLSYHSYLQYGEDIFCPCVPALEMAVGHA